MGEKIRVDRDVIKSIAIMSVPAAMMVPISIPLAVLIAVASGSFISRPGADGVYEIEVPTSLGEWVLKDNPVYRERIYGEAKKKASAIYWNRNNP